MVLAYPAAEPRGICSRNSNPFNNIEIMKIVFITLLSACSLLLKGQTTEPRMLDPFEEIYVSGKIEVELILGDEERVEVEVHHVEPGKVITESDGKELQIKMKPDIYPDERQVLVRVTFDDLNKLTATTGGMIWSDEVFTDDYLELNAFSGGDIQLEVWLDNLKAKVGQGSIIQLYGQTDRQEVKITSGGTYSAYEMKSNECIVTANTGGKAKVQVSDFLNARASTRGFIGYVGDPDRIKSNDSFGGEIIKTYLE